MNRLECRGLTKRFGPIPALDGVDLAIQPGRIVGLLGPNGSGKSTLIKLVTGLLTPTEGEIAIDGMAPGPATHGVVSYLPERPSLPQWMTVEGLQDFYEDFFPDFRREVSGEMLDRLEIEQEDFFSRVRQGYDALAVANPGRIVRIDASRTIEQVFEAVRGAVERLL